MEDKIIELLKADDKALSVYDIYDSLKLKTTEDLKELLKVLNNLEDTLKIYRTKKDKYMIFQNCQLKIGTFIGNKKGFGFVDIEGDEDVHISKNNTNNAVHGDKVIVEITSKKGKDLDGRIVRIVDRKLDNLVGEYIVKDNKAYIQLDNDKLNITVVVPKELSLGAVPGHKVLVKVTNKLQGNTYNGQILKILGHKTDPGVDILSITAKYNINDEFSEEVMAEVDKLPDEVKEEEMIGREDLREEIIFTIDGDDTKDIDDAISIERLENNNFKLGVHIADVSYYVKDNTKLDEEAYNRGTSVYLADRVIPMLPRKLSNGICSLNPNVDRLAMSCVMEIDEKGNVVDYNIFESVIRSKKQMTYKNVNKIMEENIVPEGYEEFEEKIKDMQELAHRLRKNKIRRGYIDFEIDEPKLIVDDEGLVTDVLVRERGEGEKLIEDFMIAANETVATHVYFMNLPFVYRIHGEPNEEKIQNFLKFIGILGYKVNGKIKEITPIAMQRLLDDLKEKKEFHILSQLLLRSMQKAVYDKTNIGHFGLGSKCYTHFTSPIRRYPDTTVHRLLRTYLFKKDMSEDTIEYWEGKLPFLTEHTSERERASVECEREVDQMKIAEYMEKHIGEEHDGIVSSVVNFGLFVQLPNLIEGLIRLDDLKDDRYIYDETTFSLIGQRTKKIYRLGDELHIRVKAASKINHTVDFELAPKKGEEDDKEES
ncbi:MAG: ribonuclease R [Bacilli bacterium]|nr:ribonuclease R [Bacilli bacterium]